MSQNSEAVRLLLRLLSKYSPSGEEDEAQGELFSILLRNGFENVRRDQVGNVMGEKGDGDRTLLFCSHIDTVPGRIEVRLESGRVYGRGAVDAKASLLAMALAASSYRGRGLRLIYASVIGEEADSKGVVHLLEEIPPPDYVLIGEPTGTRTVAIAYRGSTSVLMRITTRGGHSSSPLDENNAILQAVRIMEHLKASFTFSKDDFSNIGVSMTMLRGGHGDSRIPEECETSLNLRYPPQIGFEELLRMFSSAIAEYIEKNEQVKILYEFKDHLDGYFSKKEPRMINAARMAIRDVLGKELLLIRKLGTSDFNYTGLRWNRPQIAWGPGDPSLAHSSEESISLEEFISGIRVYENFLNNLAFME